MKNKETYSDSTNLFQGLVEIIDNIVITGKESDRDLDLILFLKKATDRYKSTLASRKRGNNG